MNLSEIRARVWRRLDEDASSPLRYTAEIVDEVINDGVQLFIARTGMKLATTTLTQRAGQLWYDLPEDCIRVQSVRNIETSEPLLPVDWRDLDEVEKMARRTPYNKFDGLRRRWTTVYEYSASSYLIFGLNQIGLWPMVETAASASTGYWDMSQETGPVISIPDTESTFSAEVGLVGDMESEAASITFGADTGLVLSMEWDDSYPSYRVTYTADVGETSLGVDADEAPIPYEYQSALVDYCTGRLLAPGGRGQALQAAQDAIGRFMAVVDLGGRRSADLGRVWAGNGRVLI